MESMSPILRILSDNCLQKVFKTLHLRDLCNVASTCKRFKANAEEVFKLSFTSLDMLQLIKGETSYHSEWFMVRFLTERFFNRFEQVLHHFGSTIKALRLTGIGEKEGMDENALLLLVKTHCPSLKELTLIDIGKSSDEFSTTELIPMFNGLEKLKLQFFGDFRDDVSASFADVLANCEELIHLEVRSGPTAMWMGHTFPKLEILEISDCYDFDSTDFEPFLQCHEKLRTLKYEDRDITTDFFRCLSKVANTLETFHCDFSEIWHDEEDEVEKNILELSKLRSLRNLKFSCDTDTLKLLVNAFDQNGTPIEHFEILHSKIDVGLITGLRQLKMLKTLKLRNCKMTKSAIIRTVNRDLLHLISVTMEDIKGVDLYGHEMTLAANVHVLNTPKTSTPRHSGQVEQSALILNILHDDCLTEIFEYLPLTDLCSVAVVCKRFQQNAQTSFKLHYASFKTDQIPETHGHGFVCTDLKLAERLFKNFGLFIRELHLQGRFWEGHEDHESLMYWATKHCISLEFHTLTLDNIDINTEMRWIFPWLDLFHQLQRLQLHSCRMNANFGKFLSICHIPMIQVFAFRGSAEWMDHTFRFVHTMILIDVSVPETAMIKFIKLNGQLLRLIIHGSNLSSNIFAAIAKHMPELTAFTFTGKSPNDRKIRRNVLQLARLKNLTQLQLNCSSFSIEPLIAEFANANVQLTSLKICFGMVDMPLLERLSNSMPSLKNLMLERVRLNNVSLNDVASKLTALEDLYVDIAGIDIQDIIRLLPLAQNLSKLSIGWERPRVRIDTCSYQTILEIVKSREKPTSLFISISSSDPTVFVPKNVLQKNSYWLRIENDVYEYHWSMISDPALDVDLQDSESSDDSSVAEDSDDGSVMAVTDDSDDTINMEVV